MVSKEYICKKFRMPAIIKRFRRNDRGATAVEFALVGGPFFLLMFAIIEVSIFFFAGQVFETAVDTVGRMVRTGQIDSNMSEEEFKQIICDKTATLFKCEGIYVDLTVVSTFSQLSLPPEPTDLASDLGGFQFTVPGPSQIVKLTVMYEWPIVTNYVAAGLSKLDSGNALLSTVAVFKTEPFPI
ncbi:MAG: pilus assembly protein [Rhizobiaceae bacterium]|nr:pilus assembly protein [Rhizobiaceae bacterium]